MQGPEMLFDKLNETEYRASSCFGNQETVHYFLWDPTIYLYYCVHKPITGTANYIN
jgi:hypothetical protein